MRCVLRENDLVLIHQCRTAQIDHARQVGDPDVFARQAQLHEQAQACQGCRACSGGDELDLLDVLARDLQGVQHGRTHHDRRAVLVVVEHRDLHALSQRTLDVEAVGCLDVFEVDAAEGGLQRRDGVDQLVKVAFGQLDVEHIDARKFLEQHRLAFHHRLGCQRADVAQSQHGGAVGDDGNEIASGRVLVDIGWVGHDFLARGGDAGRISQRQVALVDQLLGRRDRHFAGGRKLVVFERGAPQFGLFHIVRGGHVA